MDSQPSFETRVKNALLRMRSEIVSHALRSGVFAASRSLILRSGDGDALASPCARLEGWPRVHALCPSFETPREARAAPQDEDKLRGGLI
jgi:hypothetical protein